MVIFRHMTLDRVLVYFLYTTYTTTTWSVHYLPTLLIQLGHVMWYCDILLCDGDTCDVTLSHTSYV